MSGGSYDYVYRRIEEAAREVVCRHPHSPLHVAFATHLQAVAVAMHDLERVDSFDSSEGSEVAAMTAVLGGPGGVDRARLDAVQVTLRRLMGEVETIRRGLAVTLAEGREQETDPG